MTPLGYSIAVNVCLAGAALATWAHERIRADRAWALYRVHLRSQTVSSGQVWICNDRPLFIISTDANGVRWSVAHPLGEEYKPQQFSRYEDWRTWRERLNVSDLWLTTRDWGQEEDQ